MITTPLHIKPIILQSIIKAIKYSFLVICGSLILINPAKAANNDNVDSLVEEGQNPGEHKNSEFESIQSIPKSILQIPYNAPYEVNLHYFLNARDETKAVELINNGAFSDQLDGNGISPLIKALHFDMKSVFEKLINSGANLNLYAQGESYDINLSSFYSFESFINGTKSTAKDQNGLLNNASFNIRPVLHQAVLLEKIEAIKLLANKGADLNSLDFENFTPLHIAYLLNKKEAFISLLKAGADPNIRLPNEIPLAFSKELKENKFFKRYQKRDSDFTLLMLAAASDDIEAIKALINAGAKNYLGTKKFKINAISIACMYKNFGAARELLGVESDIDKLITVDLSKQIVKVIQINTGKILLYSKCSSGKKGYKTPTGEFIITNKHEKWTSTLYDSSMPFFSRLSASDFGFHAGAIPNYPASHGCIRLPYHSAKKLFKICPVGTLTIIKNKINKDDTNIARNFVANSNL